MPICPVLRSNFVEALPSHMLYLSYTCCQGTPKGSRQTASGMVVYKVEEFSRFSTFRIGCEFGCNSAGKSAGDILQPAEPVSCGIKYESHPLDTSPSPLLRALPTYEREFRGHLLRANAFADAARARLAQSEQLLGEMVRFCL